jgi:putative membrane protein
MKQWPIVAGVTYVLVASSILAGQGTGTGSTPVTGQKPTNTRQAENPDAMFMRTASQSSMAEIAHGELATKNASSQEVRNFAQRMVDDHTKANAELKALASKQQTTLPAELGQKHQAMQDKLAKMKGEEFDRAYMQHMVGAHTEAVKLFEQESKNGKDADTRAWAAKTLPVVQEHLKLATAINAKVGKAGTEPQWAGMGGPDVSPR